MQNRSAEPVVAWSNGLDSDKRYVAAIANGAIAYRLRTLTDGKRGSGLRQRFDRFVAFVFDQRVLRYDEPLDPIYGEL